MNLYFPFYSRYNKYIYVLIKHFSSQFLSKPVRSDATAGEQLTAEPECSSNDADTPDLRG